MFTSKSKNKSKKKLADCRLKTEDTRHSPHFAYCLLPTAYLFRILLTALCLLVFTTEINPTIRYVSPTGSNIPPYLTWEDAANSIQDCIDISEFGDTIYVANGVYEEQVVMINGLALIGAGTDSCIIDTRDLITSVNTVAVVVADSCLFTGFYILLYYNWEFGFGINAAIGNGHNLITNNKITRGARGITPGLNSIVYNNNFEYVSAGARLFNSNAVIRKNIIYIDQNAQTSLGAIDIEAFDNTYTPIIDSNYIEVLRGLGEGVLKFFGTNPIIRNNEIRLKHVGAGGIRLSGIPDSVNVFNNLIYAEVGLQGIYSNVTNSRLLNNYIAGNFNGRILRIGNDNVVKNNVITGGSSWGVDAWGTENLIFQYNNVWDNEVNYSGFTPDTTNLSVDPMVVNDDKILGELDFHLQMFSPLIDAGDPEMIDEDSSRIDIGLYGGLYGETYKYLDLPPRAPRNLTGIVDSATIIISWNPNTEADFGYYKLFRDTTAGFIADSSTLVMSLTDTFYTHIIPPDVNAYYYKLTATDNQGNESEVSEELAVSVTSVNTGEPTVVSNYILYQNYPNPFNPSTKIAYKLKERGYIKLYVYAVSGELVSVLVNQTQEAGYYEVEFSSYGIRDQESGIRELASGVYIYQIMVKNENNLPVFTDMKKMILVK